MVKEYLKKLRDGLTENVKRSEEMMLFLENEKARHDADLNKTSKKLEQMSELGYTKEDMVRVAERATVFLPSKDEVIENLKNMPPMAPFDLDENGKIVPAKRRK